MTNEGRVFYVQAFYHGGMTNLEIIPDAGHFCVASDGKIIAELHCNTVWEQISGVPLPQEVLESIYQQMEQKKS